MHGLESVCPGYSIRNLSTAKDLIEGELKNSSLGYLRDSPFLLGDVLSVRVMPHGAQIVCVSGVAAACVTQPCLRLMQVRRSR